MIEIEKRYKTLRFVLKVTQMGFELLLMLGVLAIFFSLVPNEFFGWLGSTTLFFTGLAFIVTAIFGIAFVQLFYVFLDIEVNTRETAKILDSLSKKE